MPDKETIAVYDKQVDKYAATFGSDEPSAALKQFMAHLPNGAFVLDLGCGPGNSSNIMRNAGFKPDATDASAKMVEFANRKFGIGARLATFEEISGTDIYDGIWANFSLLHASKEDFPRHLTKLHTIIKPLGVFHIGLKTGTGSKRDKLGRYYTFYEEDELHEFLQSAGYQVFETRRGEEAGLAGDVSPWVTMLANAIK